MTRVSEVRVVICASRLALPWLASLRLLPWPASLRLLPWPASRLALPCLAALLVLAGCGSTQPTLYRDDGFDAIARDEAIIERERSVALGAEAEACAGACGAVAAICEAAERICAVAQDLQEAPALARCGRARESCTASRDHVARTCACAVGDAPSGA